MVLGQGAVRTTRPVFHYTHGHIDRCWTYSRTMVDCEGVQTSISAPHDNTEMGDMSALEEDRTSQCGRYHAACYLYGTHMSHTHLRVELMKCPQFSAWMASGSNSPMWTTIIVGVVTQYWLRRSHPRWFKKYNYILGGALDGGSSVMIFILSFAVFGASGKSKPFPTWAGNPTVGNTDYCNGNGALD